MKFEIYAGIMPGPGLKGESRKNLAVVIAEKLKEAKEFEEERSYSWRWVASHFFYIKPEGGKYIEGVEQPSNDSQQPSMPNNAHVASNLRKLIDEPPKNLP